LAVIWIENGLGVVPTEFETLVDELVKEKELKSAIESLVRAKRDGEELDYGPRINPINDFIEHELERFENYEIGYDQPAAPIEKLDELFINVLAEVWGSDER
jgi:predicted nucleotidyltransferase